jgi:arsenate reductase (thioredoxin)
MLAGGATMKRKLALVISLVVLLGGIVGAARTEPIGDARVGAPIVFVCRNGVSMSVWAAAYFNRLAAQRGLPERAAARASLPTYTAVPLRMRFALAIDGFRLGGYRPHVIDAEDGRTATLIVTIDDAVLPPDARPSAAERETWQGFPPMRERYFPSRAALKVRVEDLVERLERRRSDG